jgi:hypothetical protein
MTVSADRLHRAPLAWQVALFCEPTLWPDQRRTHPATYNTLTLSTDRPPISRVP